MICQAPDKFLQNPIQYVLFDMDTLVSILEVFLQVFAARIVKQIISQTACIRTADKDQTAWVYRISCQISLDVIVKRE